MAAKTTLTCPHCGTCFERSVNPAPTADVIIEVTDRIVLIERKYPPTGWAIPGGFVEYGETVEQAAVREAKEETSLDVALIHLLGVYSDPGRDPRSHTITTVFVGKAVGEP
ncbi:MAG TPA: NUDIX hydrolase, partial [bacterium]